MLHYHVVSMENHVRRQDSERERNRLALIELARSNGALEQIGLLPRLAAALPALFRRKATVRPAATISAARATQC